MSAPELFILTFKHGQEIAHFEGHKDFFKYEIEQAGKLLQRQAAGLSRKETKRPTVLNAFEKKSGASGKQAHADAAERLSVVNAFDGGSFDEKPVHVPLGRGAKSIASAHPTSHVAQDAANAAFASTKTSSSLHGEAPAATDGAGGRPVVNVSDEEGDNDSGSGGGASIVNSADREQKHSLRSVLQWKLDQLKVEAVWEFEPEGLSGHDRKVKVTFPSMGGRRTETILEELHHLGFGAPHSKSTVWVLPMVIRQPVDEDMEVNESDNNITSRLTVQQVINSINGSAALTLDYVLLCFSASVIAAIGLGRDDNVATVASMLISPLMSPILAITFGTTVRDYSLVRTGLVTELAGLSICVATGFVGGMSVAKYADGWGWPSDFMSDRGQPISLVFGLAIAVPSGIGVALSVLGNNTGSLVGVAISASLLPPAVNAGLSWGFALVGHFIDEDVDARENALIGTYSFMLTALNILVIYLMGLLFLYIKKVAPPALGQSYFFWHDIPLFVDYNKTLKGKEAEQFLKDMENNAQELGTTSISIPRTTKDITRIVSIASDRDKDSIFGESSTTPNSAQLSVNPLTSVKPGSASQREVADFLHSYEQEKFEQARTMDSLRARSVLANRPVRFDDSRYGPKKLGERSTPQDEKRNYRRSMRRRSVSHSFGRAQSAGASPRTPVKPAVAALQNMFRRPDPGAVAPSRPKPNMSPIPEASPDPKPKYEIQI